MDNIHSYREAKLLQDLRLYNVTVEDMARAWASMEKRLKEFDAEKGKSCMEAETGTYLGYIVEIKEILARAIRYAQERKQNVQN